METQTTEASPETTQPEVKPPDTIKERTQAQYRFNDAELVALGKRLSTTRKDIERLDSELDSIKQDYKAKKTTVELEQNCLCQKLDDGFEMREVEATVYFNDPTQGRKTYRHSETNELIREEAMTYSDWQLPMFRTPEGKDATAPVPSEAVPTITEEFENSQGTKEDAEHIGDDTAGKTSLADALAAAAAGKELPRVPVVLSPDHSPERARAQFRKAAKKAGWNEAAIDLIDDAAKACDDLNGVIALLSAHTVATTEGAEA